MKFTEIQISGLREGKHSFAFRLDSRFAAEYPSGFFADPVLEVEVQLDYSETMLKAEILVSGSVEIICDRSLDPFRKNVSEKAIHFYKFGEEEQELSDEMEVISPERVKIDFDQLIYDTVALSLPQKKIHPRFEAEEQEDDDFSEGKLVYSSGEESEEKNNDEERESRWSILKNLN